MSISRGRIETIAPLGLVTPPRCGGQRHGDRAYNLFPCEEFFEGINFKTCRRGAGGQVLPLAEATHVPEMSVVGHGNVETPRPSNPCGLGFSLMGQIIELSAQTLEFPSNCSQA